MTVTYDSVLILLSIGVAILGSLSALALSRRGYGYDRGTWRTSLALANSGLIMGSTIWAVHFIAMMAVSVPVRLNYGMLETIGSIAIAIAANGAGLSVARTRKLGAASIPVGGLLMGSESPACTISAWVPFAAAA